MVDRHDREQPHPLGYEPAPRRRQGRGIVAILCIIAAIYGIAGFFIARNPAFTVAILEIATVVAAPVVGIYFGTQNKDYWA